MEVETTIAPHPQASLALVGHPNVGKSALFRCMTGQHVIVANYPGTTVAVSRARMQALPDTELIDTPGVVALPTSSEDEHVTARVLLEDSLQAVLQVGDAKNVRRTLLLTIQLAEMGLPLALVLNMSDEARQVGVEVNPRLLSDYLSIPVLETIATRGVGIPDLIAAMRSLEPPQFRLTYPPEIEHALAEIAPHLPRASISARALGLLWLSEDAVAASWLRRHIQPADYERLCAHREKLQLSFIEPLGTVIQGVRLGYASRLARETVQESGAGWRALRVALGRGAMHPVWGWPILAAVLYAIYWFVGVFGAGTLVDWIEGYLFETLANPWLAERIAGLIPVPFVVDFLVGPYGLWTVGMTYALALILPVVSTFFLAFSLLEDSGYLPRLVALSNRVFAFLGLNGRAVLPMVLGLGCVTMAALTTRVLESRRERFLVTLLLALAVPCSAQLGVVMGLLASISLKATLIWAGVVAAVLLVVGRLAAMLAPGERTPLMVELPPLRWPQMSNVAIKTVARVEWYLKEVVPFFLLGAALMFAFDRLGWLAGMEKLLQPLVVDWLGLPAQASNAFLMGFLRRDFGATGLFLMESRGLLSPVQVVVAMVTVTLFIPCVASILVIAREQGRKTALGMVLLVFPLAFVVAGLLARLLAWTGWL